MSGNLLKGFNIANVERVKIETEETTAKEYIFDTASSVDAALAVSAGQEVEQRIKNTLMGLLKTDDLVKGYDLTMQDQRLIAKVFALIDGGTLTTPQSPTGEEFTKYEGPVAGGTVTRTKFTLTFYTSDRDTGSNVVTYHSWKFTGCQGKPVPLGGEDGAFHTIQYTIESRPATGAPTVTIAPETTLPVPA